MMKMLNALRALARQEDINFLLTNRVPRQLLTHAMGRISKIRNPLVCRLSIFIWKLFTDLDLSDARTTRFESLHDCFTRSLRAGARPVDPSEGILVSPSDGIVGACGAIEEGQMLQAKGMPYRLEDLVGSVDDARAFLGGTYVTLRLTSAMYHRFHAPQAMQVDRVQYISGDTWNVNPIALRRVERLFCRNERAVLHARLQASGERVALVAVAAILVASVRLNFLDVLLHLRYRGPHRIACSHLAVRGEELGWFEHGSTIIVLAPRGFGLCAGVQQGQTVRMGQALMTQPAPASGITGMSSN